MTARPTYEPPSSSWAQPTPPEVHPAIPWHRKHWVHLVAAAVLGLGIGGAAGGSAASDADARASSAERQAEEAREQLVTAEQARDTAVGEKQEAQVLAGKAQEDAKAAVAKAQADAKAGVAAEAAKVKEAEAAVAAREKAVGVMEVEVAANTIEGEGTYIVGEDIKPGTYKSAGGENCYWERSSKDGDIIANDLSDGPAVMNVRSSDYSVSVSNCAPFVLQR